MVHLDKNLIKTLLKNDLFHEIEEKQVESMLKCLGMSEKAYEKNSMMIMPGSFISSFGILIAGNAQITRDDENGNRSILSQLEKGDIFGESYAAASVQEIPVGVHCSSPCLVVWIPINKVIETCEASCCFHQKLVKNMMGILAMKNIAMNEKMRILACKTTREKLLTYLKQYAHQEGGNRFLIPFTRYELAEFLNVDRSALSRELSKLKNEGILEYKKNAFEFKK